MNYIFLHGFIGSSEDFDLLRKALGNPESVFAPDWPGHGTRASLRNPSDYTLQAHLDIIDAAVTATTGPICFLGYSLGGRILQHWLMQNPVLPKGSCVFLVSTSPGLSSATERANRIAGDAAVAQLLRQQGMTRFLHYWHWQTMFQPLMHLPPERLSPILRRRSACDPEGLALSLEGVGTGALQDTWSFLPTLKTPTQLIVGELDSKYVTVAREMQTLAPQLKVEVVKSAGHSVVLEKPEDVADILRIT